MSKETTINYGVIGVGYLGSFHVQQLKEIETVNMVGVFDINITGDGRTLFKESFINDIVDGNIDKSFKKHLIENNTFMWDAPSNGMRLYHSPSDDAVPYINSLHAISYFKSKISKSKMKELHNKFVDLVTP